MCGIMAYVGKEQAGKVLYGGLKRLEYRGYDSAGIAVLNGNTLSCVKNSGMVGGISSATTLLGSCGVGHTRWATHGKATAVNAHPHTCGKFTVVHNGIIENYIELKKELKEKGHVFYSETDSEVTAHLFMEAYQKSVDFLSAVKDGIKRLKGSFALAVLCSDYPEKIVCVRKKSPLLVGVSPDGFYAASDLPALSECKKVFPLPENSMVLLDFQKEKISLFDFKLTLRSIRWEKNRFSLDEGEKGANEHFMLSEIYQTPTAAKRTLNAFDIKQAERLKRDIFSFSDIVIVGCGTAYHSGLTGKICLESALKKPVDCVLAGELCSGVTLLKKGWLIIAVSQSGETADTISCCLSAKKRGAKLAVITNVGYSTLSNMADYLFVTQAGTEVGVAATKTYIAQLVTFFALSEFLKREKVNSLLRLPNVLTLAMELRQKIKEWVKGISTANGVYFIGRGQDYPTALEGSLKLREVSYLSGGGFSAAELKHGSIALMCKGVAVVGICTQKRLKEKMKNALSEVSSRGAETYLLTFFTDMGVGNTILLPPCPEWQAAVVSAIAVQFLAYETAIAKGLDPDKPRNLAKSVTVE